MNEKPQSMHIVLSAVQTRRIFEQSREQTRAEVDAVCEPAGFYIQLLIGVGGGFPSSVDVRVNGKDIDLGDVEVTLVDE